MEQAEEVQRRIFTPLKQKSEKRFVFAALHIEFCPNSGINKKAKPAKIVFLIEKFAGFICPSISGGGGIRTHKSLSRPSFQDWWNNRYPTPPRLSYKLCSLNYCNLLIFHFNINFNII